MKISWQLPSISVYGNKAKVRRGELIRYTEREQLLLDLLEENYPLTEPLLPPERHLSRRAAEHLLAKFVRYDIVEPVFEGHKFHFKLK